MGKQPPPLFKTHTLHQHLALGTSPNLAFSWPNLLASHFSKLNFLIAPCLLTTANVSRSLCSPLTHSLSFVCMLLTHNNTFFVAYSQQLFVVLIVLTWWTSTRIRRILFIFSLSRIPGQCVADDLSGPPVLRCSLRASSCRYSFIVIHDFNT